MVIRIRINNKKDKNKKIRKISKQYMELFIIQKYHKENILWVYLDNSLQN